MSSIVALVGSPKPNKSSSGAIVDCISEILQTYVTQYRALDIINMANRNEVERDILQADILLFVFPLYVDSLPATLLEVMYHLENAIQNSTNSLPRVYAICNCGFYDAEQTATALHIMQNYCNKTGFSWQYGLGIGWGGMIAEKSTKIATHAPLANIFRALTELCTDISQKHTGEKDNIFIKPGIPRFMYHLGGNTGWKMMARKNSIKKNLRAKPHEIS
jgi:multimeric flavodoxin WrbA